jgi:hypothetical protein
VTGFVGVSYRLRGPLLRRPLRRAGGLAVLLRTARVVRVRMGSRAGISVMCVPERCSRMPSFGWLLGALVIAFVAVVVCVVLF